MRRVAFSWRVTAERYAQPSPASPLSEYRSTLPLWVVLWGRRLGDEQCRWSRLYILGSLEEQPSTCQPPGPVHVVIIIIQFYEWTAVKPRATHKIQL